MNNYRPDIDGLRAFSIIAVVVYHAFPTLLPGGFVGVDVFFVISGYLITGIILQSQAKAQFSAAEFYRRRIQRIIPALLLVLLFCLVAGWWVLLPYEYAMLGQQTAASSVFAPNILFWTEAGYFDTDSKLKPLLHLWSLGVEEQFYLLWPLALVLATRTQVKSHWLICGLMLASFSLGIVVTGDHAANFFLPQFRVWELLVGALLASITLKQLPGPTGNILAGCGLVMLGCAVFLINRESGFPGWWALLPTLGAAILIGAGPGNRVNRMLGSAPLVFIGKISFPLYLWHWPLLTFARIMEEGEPALEIRISAVALSTVLAWLSYSQVEKRLRYHSWRHTPTLLLCALFALGAMGFGLFKLGGIPARMEALNTQADAFYWQELGLHERDDCSETLGVAGRCLSDGKPPHIAVVGDSHSTNTFFALAHHYRDSDIGVMRLGKGGCPPLYGIRVRAEGNSDQCLQTTQSNLDWVIQSDAVQTVYLSSMGPTYINPRQTRYKMHDPEDPALADQRSIFTAGLDKTVRLLRASGKDVVLVIDWPGLGFNPKNCVNTRPLRLTKFEPRECWTPRKRHNTRSADYRHIILATWRNNPGTSLWDTPRVFCNGKRCDGMRDGLMLYRDPGHLTQQGSKYLGEHLSLQVSPDLE
ncbi:MAG: acyltransferase family protein [Halioglobus sp.]